MERGSLAPAISSVDGLTLSIGEVVSVVDGVAGELRARGVGARDVVALVLTDGPDLAALFMGVASSAICAPLNPRFQRQEFEFYLNDLKPKLIVAAAKPSEALVEASNQLGIAMASFAAGHRPQFSGGESVGPPSRDSLTNSSEHVALMLHTSGTTGRPKMVPLSQANLMASAHNIGKSLQLGNSDRCLNVMPLFHIHGLVAAVLASLAAGGSVICSNGFDARNFWDWLRLEPTWFTAVPTIHQAILERQPETLEATTLRFIRSSSSPLPPVVMSRLETAFSVPVVEAYGMSEAAHQIACNPLPPVSRKPGSVGLPAGPEVAILDSEGTVLEAGNVGEVAIRGANVFRGYSGQERATGSPAEESWFRTGDLGQFDAEGYLFLRGRLKEIINRGGETIAPREIDEALLGHPAVQQALAFSVPDQRLGEQVAAIVVLDQGSRLTELELREFVASQLSISKVPRKIVFQDEIPRGATGKLTRIGLAEKLGLADLDFSLQPQEPTTPPRTEVEKLMSNLWSEVLGRSDLSVFDRFLESGGDSLLAVKLVARVQDALGLQPSMIEFFDRPTIAAQSELIEDLLLAESERADIDQESFAGSS